MKETVSSVQHVRCEHGTLRQEIGDCTLLYAHMTHDHLIYVSYIACKRCLTAAIERIAHIEMSIMHGAAAGASLERCFSLPSAKK